MKVYNFRDSIIEKVVDKFVSRSNVGFKKYGVTLQDDPGEVQTWLKHLQEELMDAVNYLEKLQDTLDSEQPEKCEACCRCNCKEQVPKAETPYWTGPYYFGPSMNSDLSVHPGCCVYIDELGNVQTTKDV